LAHWGGVSGERLTLRAARETAISDKIPVFAIEVANFTTTPHSPTAMPVSILTPVTNSSNASSRSPKKRCVTA
jgi:hypothetical protein